MTSLQCNKRPCLTTKGGELFKKRLSINLRPLHVHNTHINVNPLMCAHICTNMYACKHIHIPKKKIRYKYFWYKFYSGTNQQQVSAISCLEIILPGLVRWLSGSVGKSACNQDSWFEFSLWDPCGREIWLLKVIF